MRCVLFIVLITSASLAAAAPNGASRKPAPPNLPSEILSVFVGAIVADKAGDLETAEQGYRSANEKAPHANTVYNLADVLRRMEQLPKAIESYKQYLALVPNAPDRKPIEKLIAQLARTEFTIVVDGDDLDGIIFVDGKLVGPSPQVLHLADGTHLVARVSPGGYRHRMVKAKPMGVEHLQLSAGPYAKESGNVILSASPELTSNGNWEDQGVRFQMHARFALPPGHYETRMFNSDRVCTPLVFDAPKPTELVHVYIDAQPVKGRECQTITVRQQKVKVMP